jgi:hypothetical protein
VDGFSCKVTQEEGVDFMALEPKMMQILNLFLFYLILSKIYLIILLIKVN